MNARRHPLLLWAIAVLVMASFAWLGAWQLERAHEKRAMLAASSSALATRTPQPLSVVGDRQRAQRYDWVEVEGRFADAPAVLLDNQQRAGKVGVRAYRRFDVQGGPSLLVDLGWVALPPDRTLPPVPRDAGRTSLSGLLLPPPGAGLGMGAPAVREDGTLLATTIDLQALRAPLQAPTLAPRVLRPAPEAGFGFERDFDILPNTLPPERHLGYAVQWFALALAVLITALLLTWRARRAARRHRSASR